MEKTNVKKSGFTIVELLTVMAVIAVLIGLLIPALGLVKDNAKRIQQKAQFHSIDVGVELYKSEFGAYPESNDNSTGTNSSPVDTFDPTPYCGANKLAEAMVGRDLLGYHPKSGLNSTGTNSFSDPGPPPSTGTLNVYAAFSGNAIETAQENLQARKGPYVDLENANAFAMDDVYSSTSNAKFPGTGGFVNNYAMDMSTGTQNSYPLVLCDVYAKTRTGTNPKKTGTPILYFRARTNYTMQDFTTTTITGWDPEDDDIYCYNDNANLIAMGMPDDGISYSIEIGGNADPYENFENMIINENVQTVRRPYRADSFILISAGKDGDFGTADDVFNFDKEVIE